MSTGNLLEGWTRVKFGDIAASITERVDDPSASGVDRYVGLEHLDQESTSIRRWGSPNDVESTKLRFYPGDVIYGRRRAYQRKLGVADFDGICSAHALVLRAKPAVCLPEFLPYFLQSDAFHQRALDISVGSLSPTINWKTLAVQEFALPPLDEQARIAALIGSVDQSLSSLAGAAAAAETLKQAQTSQDLSRSGRSVPLGDLADVQYGLTLNARRAGLPVGYPYLRVANVQRGFIDLTEVKTVGCGDEEVETYTLADGDILVVEGHANIAGVGRAAIWRSPALPAVLHQNHLLRVRATGQMHPEYLLAVMNSPLGRGYFASRAKSTSGLNTINSTVLRSFPVPVIDVDEQEDLVRRLSSADDLLGVLDRDVSATRHLRQSLLADALEGRRVH